MPTVADLVAFLEHFAPLDLAEEWDNVGLLLGNRRHEVSRVLTCLTLTPDVAVEAIEQNASLIVTHHPVLFRPVKRLTSDDAQGKMLLELSAARIAVYSPHTAYDSAAAGINQQLADMLGLTDVAPLRAVPEPPKCKLVCFVPREHLTRVQEALWSAGAGVIGDYSQCGFVLDGTGSFLGSEAANPTVGAAGRLEAVAEARLEVVCPERLVPDAIRRLRAAHPYEEPAYDVYPLKAQPGQRGSGRVGTFSRPQEDSGFEIRDSGSGGKGGHGSALAASPSRDNDAARLKDLVALIKSRLNISSLQVVGDPEASISRVGICCGSGGELLAAAIAAGCNAFLTGEATFHKCLEARAAGIALVLAGHYATERPAMEYLAAVLAREFPEISASPSRRERDPLQFN